MTEELNGGCLDEREAFEAWVLTQPGGTEYAIRRRDMAGSERLGSYVEPAVDFAWQALCALSTSKQAGAEPVADLDNPAYDAYFGQVRKYADSLPRYIIWDSKHPDYPVEWTNPGRPTHEGEFGFFRHDVVNELMAEAASALSVAGRQDAHRQGYEQGWHDRACNSQHAYLARCEEAPPAEYPVTKAFCAQHPGTAAYIINKLAHQIDAAEEAPAAAGAAQAVAKDWTKIEAIVESYVDEYEMRGETEDGRDACYTPSDDDRALLRDCIAGLLAEPEFVAALAATPAPETAPATAEPFQTRVQPWLMACFGEMIAGDREERNHRFIEEALELVQACGCTASEAHQLVDYVFARPVGEKAQEVGGVMVTLAALCLAQGLDMAAAGETELARIWTKVEQIRAKQAAKPKHSPLPVAPAPCGYCNDTGDVHGLDGEWRGVCSCPAGDRVRAAVTSPDDTPLETGEGDAR